MHVLSHLLQTSVTSRAGHVFNRIATAQQAQIPHPSFAKTVKTLYSTGGIKEFYKGLRWNLLSSCAKAGTRWTLTSSLYHAVESYVPSDVRDNAFWSDAVAVGFSAAFVETTFVLTPMESFRTLEMTTALQKHKQAVSETSKKQGMIRTLLKGWDRVFVRQLTSWVTYLVAYDKVKTLVLGNPDDNKPRGQASLVQKAAVGVGTGAVACVLTTPLDMLRTQTQMEGASATMQGSLTCPKIAMRLILRLQRFILLGGREINHRSRPTRAAAAR